VTPTIVTDERDDTNALKKVGEKETFSSTTLEPFRRKQNLWRKNDEFVDKLSRRWLERREASSPVMENNDRKSENK
jgi:hypothetical protein